MFNRLQHALTHVTNPYKEKEKLTKQALTHAGGKLHFKWNFFLFFFFVSNHALIFLLLNVLLGTSEKREGTFITIPLTNNVQRISSWLHVAYWLCRRIKLHKSNTSKTDTSLSNDLSNEKNIKQLVHVKCNIFFPLEKQDLSGNL
jgi:hypothetical protein